MDAWFIAASPVVGPCEAGSEGNERVPPRCVKQGERLFYTNVFWLVFGGAAATLGVNLANTVMPLHMAKIGLDAEQISTP
ncbi:MAG: hypothetical protein AB1505_18650 [Candidatus Latescibacterota bacterium]